MAIWGRVTSLIAGIGISRASSVVIEPALEPERQAAWVKSAAAILEPPDLAILVAQGLMMQADAEPFALRNGMAAGQFDALVQAALRAAPVAQALDIWRRQPDQDAARPLFEHAMAKAQLEQQWWPLIEQLYTIRVPADLLAFAHQRGIVDNPADPVTGQLLIPVSPPTTNVTDVNGQPSPIQQLPVDLDVLAEFQATGWDFTRAAVNARARGLPPAPGELLQLVNRGTISTGEYYVGIGEGDTRNEWRDYLLTLKRQLLTPHNYAELQLRGYIDQPTRDTGAALSGMEPGDAQLLYDVLGRGITTKAMQQAIARGGVYGGDTTDIPASFLATMERGNLRPEYYPLEYALRFTYPSYFVIKPLVADGAITVDYATQIFENEGWPPDLASAAAQSFAPSGAAATNKHVTSSTTTLVTAARKAFIGNAATQDQAAAALTAAGVDPGVQAQLFTLWSAQRTLEQLGTATA